MPPNPPYTTGSGPANPPDPPLPQIADLCWPDWSTGANSHVAQATGITFLRSQIRPAQVTDGTSKTFMLGEKSMALGGTSDGSAYTGHVYYTLRWESSPPVSDLSPNNSYFGSAHPTVANMVMCDGSVQSILFDIDATAFKALGGRNDNVAIDVP